MKRIILLTVLALALAGCDERGGVLFSDDFESGAVGAPPPAPWVVSNGAGRVAIDDSKSRSGRKSVHFVSGEQYRNRAFMGIFGKPFFPLARNRYYGSMYMWLDEASPDGVHWTMIQSSGKVAGRDFTADVRYGGQHRQQLMANYDTRGVKSDCWQHSTVKIPEKRWFRVDWFFDGRKNLMNIRLDGRELGEITVAGRGQGCLADDLAGEWLFPVFDSVEIGWVDYQPNGGGRSLWIDDFKISSKPLKD